MKEQIITFINHNYPISVIHIEKVTGEMYRCETTSGTYYARVSNYKTYQEQLEEVTLTNYLHSNQVGVAPAIPSNSNNLLETIDLPTAKTVVLFAAAPGIHLPRSEWTAPVLYKLGQQIGRMHTYTKEFSAKHPLKHLIHWHTHEEYNFTKHIPQGETVIQSLAHKVLAQVKQLPQTPANYGIIHSDVWLENVLVTTDNKITIIDFQDCEQGYYLYDLAVPLYSALEFSFTGNENINDHAESLLQALLQGYREENSMPSEMLQHLGLFLKMKQLFEYSLMHLYWDKSSLSEEQVRIMNLHRLLLESNHPIIKLDYSEFI